MLRLFRVSSLLILLLHALAAAAWTWMMPRGFPLLHARTLSNIIAPLLLFGFVGVALWAARRQRKPLLAAMMLALAAMWLGIAAAFIIAYPHSHKALLLAPLTAVTVTALAVPWKWVTWTRGTTATAAVALLVGVLMPLTQKSPPATTHPLNIAAPADLPPVTTSAPKTARLSQDVHIGLPDGRVSFQRGRLTIDVFPLLTFISRSRDGGWIAWATRADRLGPRRQWTGLQRADGAVSTQYRDDGDHHLAVQRDDDGATAIESFSSYGRTVYSHLNTYTEIWMVGHRKPSLVFSPCPGTPVDVLDMGAPAILNTAHATGAPARLAYLDVAGNFRIVEASDAEKGPYKTLAEGKLAKTDPLTITLLDQSSPVLQITLEDWAAQVSTDLSPTAGWGLPMNAIEFSRQNESESSAVSLFITLASTSVGRGFDSVAHGPGVYRNRMSVRFVEPTPPAATTPSR